MNANGGYRTFMVPVPVQITLSLPAELAEPGAAERARLLLALDAVRSERISWREGARILGLAPCAFLDLARDHGVPTDRVDMADLAEDLTTLQLLVPR